jgi:hypothetical protein
MAIAATPLGQDLILGLGPRPVRPARPPQAVRSARLLRDPGGGAAPVAVVDGAGVPIDPLAATHVRLAPAASLSAVAAQIEQAYTTDVIVDEAGLAPDLLARTPLAVLQRRAGRHGKRLVFAAATREGSRLAVSAGLAACSSEALPLDRVAASRLDAPAGTEPVPHAPDAPARHPSMGQRFLAVTQPVPLPASARAPVRIDGTRGLSAAGAGPAHGRAGVREPATATRREVQGPAPSPQSGIPGLRPEVAAPRPSRTPGARLQITVRRLSGTDLGGLRRWRTLVAGGVAGALLLAAIALVLPAAIVTLTPAEETWTAEIPILVDPGIKKPDLAGGRLPGRAIAREVADRADAPATGRKNVPAAAASTEVVFLNKSDKAVAVPKGTILLAGATRFATQSDVVVGPSRSAARAQSYGMASVKVVAVEGGPAGNVDALKINKIEGPLGGPLEVQNNAPARGGAERTLTFVTEDDRRRLQDSLYRALSERLSQQLKAQLPATDRESVVPWSGQSPTIVEATFSKNSGDEAQSVSLTLRLRYGATVFSNEAYNSFAPQVAAAKVGDLRPGYRFVAGTVAAQPPEVVGVDNGVGRIKARAQGRLTPRLDAAQVRRDLAGRPAAEAHEHLAGLPGVARYELQHWPGWLGRLPWLGLRIGVHVAPGEPGAPPAEARPAA